MNFIFINHKFKANHYEFDIKKQSIRPIHVEPTPVVKLKTNEDPRWDGYFNGGTDFGMINWDAKNGKKYDHFWHCGYGAAFQDRYINTIFILL